MPILHTRLYDGKKGVYVYSLTYYEEADVVQYPLSSSPGRARTGKHIIHVPKEDIKDLTLNMIWEKLEKMIDEQAK